MQISNHLSWERVLLNTFPSPTAMFNSKLRHFKGNCRGTQKYLIHKCTKFFNNIHITCVIILFNRKLQLFLKENRATNGKRLIVFFFFFLLLNLRGVTEKASLSLSLSLSFYFIFMNSTKFVLKADPYTEVFSSLTRFISQELSESRHLLSSLSLSLSPPLLCCCIFKF